MFYEQIIRGQIAAERIERIADACAQANVRRRARRRASGPLLLAAGPESVERERRRAARPEVQA